MRLVHHVVRSHFIAIKKSTMAFFFFLVNQDFDQSTFGQLVMCDSQSFHSIAEKERFHRSASFMCDVIFLEFGVFE